MVSMVLAFRGAGVAMREQFQVRSASLRAASREAAEAAVLAHGSAVQPSDVLLFSHAEEPVGPPRYFRSAAGQTTSTVYFEYFWQRADRGCRCSRWGCDIG